MICIIVQWIMEDKLIPLMKQVRDSAANAVLLTNGWTLHRPAWGRDLIYVNEITDELALVIDRSPHGDFIFSDDALHRLLKKLGSCVVLRDQSRREQIVAVELTLNVAINLLPKRYRRNRRVKNGWWIVDQSFKPIATPQ